ncbi:hypothetical protein SARC_01195 [Sphaeroforma arctica JP610]|uniref:Uncharacterized protein n=1 Tax=Sphaeroforma arctica JP610 TaxID=667725 RepID=A0A0L0GEJ1_9EUKA|nr:hypothetical protein SARC_01195 [Sphaeroforma arctica JP610]KNC86658.1 hypothetical protein SARC_01195 [Sphaeroforma arctica JP610]|eukprot:XP_014160560.1 hypothetical protein SARC_01195 [Sphaeroforma arctica JP610]
MTGTPGPGDTCYDDARPHQQPAKSSVSSNRSGALTILWHVGHKNRLVLCYSATTRAQKKADSHLGGSDDDSLTVAELTNAAQK